MSMIGSTAAIVLNVALAQFITLFERIFVRAFEGQITRFADNLISEHYCLSLIDNKSGIRTSLLKIL